MSRPLRIEFPGALYHVTSRGDRREAIYLDDTDRLLHLDVLAQTLDRFDAQALAYCLMGNHYHLVLHTAQPNLSRLMRHLNGVFSQAFNRRHGLVGHVFQGRFKAILVDRDAYLLALCRYVERNPVAAGLVAQAADWRWSSYRAHVGAEPAPPWLDVAGLHAMLLQREPRGPADLRRAGARYAALVASAEQPSPWAEGLHQQVFLGNADFVAQSLAHASLRARQAKEVPRAQRQAPFNWPLCLREHGSRDAALLAAYRQAGITMTQLAEWTGLSVSRVSRVIAAQEAQ